MAILQTYCAPMTGVEERLVITATVPVGKTYRPGMVIDASTIDTTIDGNFSVYTGIAPADVKTTPLAIIINGGWEQLPDGRRPEGQTDYTQYPYNEGETFTAIFLDDHLRFQITQDCLAGNAPTLGQYLCAVNNTTQLVAGATKTSTNCLKVEALKYFRTATQQGLGMINSYVCSASVHNAIA